MVRAFLAIDLPQELKRNLFELSKIAIPESIKIKWVAEPNFHITLKFFGNISEKILEKLFKKSQKVVENYPIFKLILTNVGFFPEKKTPRVVWIGLKTEDKTLFDLQDSLEKLFKKLKIGDSKDKFHPHITLFRVKSPGNLEDFKNYLEKLSEKAKTLEGFTFKVEELTFFKSTLYPQGPLYEPLYKIRLKP